MRENYISGVFIESFPLFSIRFILAQSIAIASGWSVLLFWSGKQSLPAVFNSLFNGAFLFLTAGVLWYFFRFVGQQSILGFEDFSERKEGKGLDSPSPIWLVMAFLLSVLMIVTAYRVLTSVVISSGSGLLLRVTGVLPLVLVAYFPVGVLYQIFSQLAALAEYYLVSVEYTGDVAAECSVRVVQHDEAEDPVYFAASTRVVFQDVIFVSEDLVEDFERDELEAVIRHEEAHVENGDTRLAMIALAGSLVTLIGRNLFYVAFDYSRRESLADDAACQEPGVDALIRALEKIREENISGLSPGVGLASFSGRFEDPGMFERYFYLFYSDFALREAHLGLGERIEKLEERGSREVG